MKKSNPAEDKVNLRILSCLATNGRLPYAKIAETLRLSPNAVRDRILSMERRGIITRYRAIADHEALGDKCRVLALMEPCDRSPQAIAAAMQHPNILGVSDCAGRFGLVVEVAGRDMVHVNSILESCFYQHGYVLGDFIPLAGELGTKQPMSVRTTVPVGVPA